MKTLAKVLSFLQKIDDGLICASDQFIARHDESKLRLLLILIMSGLLCLGCVELDTLYGLYLFGQLPMFKLGLVQHAVLATMFVPNIFIVWSQSHNASNAIISIFRRKKRV